MRTITVKGTGRVTAKPDQIVIGFQMQAMNANYEKAMQLASKQIERVNEALAEIGFGRGSLKTTNFNVQTEHNSIRDKDGNYRSVFVGYACRHQMKLEFDLDMHRLSETLDAIASTTVDPQLKISFTVRDANAVSEELLRDAARNARRKAEILCDASAVQLGQLLSADYSWGELDVYSRTSFEMEDRCMMAEKCSVDFTEDIAPDDIRVSDSATFVWEIE